jgi:hypothetical protein
VPECVANGLERRETTIDALQIDGSNDTAPVQIREHAPDIFVIRREEVHGQVEPISALRSRNACNATASESIEGDVFAACIIEGTAERWRRDVDLQEFNAGFARITAVVFQTERPWKLIDTIYEREANSVVRPK